MTSDFRDKEYYKMKERFDAWYAGNLQPVLQKSESRRMVFLAMLAVLVVLGAVFYPLIVKHVLQQGGDAATGIIEGLSCLVLMAVCGPVLLYKKSVKPQVMPVFASFFGTFSYSYGGKIDDNLLRQSHLFGTYNRSKGDDCFTGTYDGVRINLAEERLDNADLRREYEISTGQRSSFSYDMSKNVFRGVCILFEMNKNFKGRTVVLKDKKIFNAFTRLPGLQTVRLEDSRFEKYFEVYSDDQIEARYLLTTAFMERMLKLRDLFGGKSIQFSFAENKLLLAVPTRQNMFEANSFFTSNVNKKRADAVFDQFYLMFSIVELLKLNTHTGM